MAARKSGLGRGLDALIPVGHTAAGYAEVPVDRVRPNPRQPRHHFDDETLEGLAASIREVGVLQPLVVRAGEDEGSYVLIAGERRLRAARLAGLPDVPVVVREGEADSTTLTEALIENVQREDLSPLEEAAAYQELLEEFGMTHDEVARRVAKSRSSVTNTLRLLQLAPPLQGLLERGEITAGHARALLGLEDEKYAVHIGERAAAEGWSVRQVEDAVRARTEPVRTAPRREREPRPEAIIGLEKRLGEQLGSPVKIDYGKRGGKVVVRFTDLDDLERIYRKFFG